MVDMMIIGAQKSGTTTLFDLLATHPGLNACTQKEPAFFAKSPDWRAELPRYESLYQDRPGTISFEGSTQYTFYPHYNLEVWEDLYEYNPALRFIYIVRDPVERVVSSYMHHYERGYTDLPFGEALVKYARLLNITRYTTQITPYIERFGRDRVHICFFEDLLADRAGLMGGIASFLDVEASGFDLREQVHSNKTLGANRHHRRFDSPSLPMRAIRKVAPTLWQRVAGQSRRSFQAKPTVSAQQRRAILYLLRHEIDGVERLTGRDLSHWRSA